MTGRTRVIVYGIRNADEALAAAEAGADALGFMFQPGSSRKVEPDEAWEISAVVPPLVSTIGVFTDASVEKFLAIEESCPLDYSQFHGSEPEEVVRQCGTRAIKTVAYRAGEVGREASAWAEIAEVDAVFVTLGDAAVEREDALAELARAARAIGRPLMVGGGLRSENVARVVRAVRPWAVGVSAGVEGAGGWKERGAVEVFCRAVRGADAAG